MTRAIFTLNLIGLALVLCLHTAFQVSGNRVIITFGHPMEDQRLVQLANALPKGVLR